MKRVHSVLGLAIQLMLLAVLVTVLIVAYKMVNPLQPLSPQPTYQPSIPAYPPPPSKQVTGQPYPPPVTSSPEPFATITPTFSDFLGTPTPLPFTPFPTPTLKPGPSPTLIPSIAPARDASGTLFYVAKAVNDVNLSFYSTNLDSSGKTTNQPKQLSSDEASWGKFIFPSPDGSLLAITGDWGGFALYNLDKGQFERIIPMLLGSEGEFLNWFPDNRHILYRDGAGPLILADPMTGDRKTLAFPAYEQIIGAAASPDGRYIVYSSASGNNSPSTGGLWIVNADGQNNHLLLNSPPLTDISWSPDGKKIVFWGNGLEIVDADGTNLHQLINASEGSQIYFLQCYFISPLWSPDSRIVAILTSQTTNSFCFDQEDNNYKGTNIVLIDVESGKVQPLLTDGSTGNIDPTWSPDGSQIAFVSNRGGTPEVWIVNIDGSNLQQITQNNVIVRFPYWRRSQP